MINVILTRVDVYRFTFKNRMVNTGNTAITCFAGSLGFLFVLEILYRNFVA